MLLRIETVRFVAGVVIENDRVVRAAPCFKKFIGQSKESVVAHAIKMRWKVQEINDEDAPNSR